MIKLRGIILGHAELYIIPNHHSTKLETTTDYLRSEFILHNIAPDEFKERSREYTQLLENRGLVITAIVYHGKNLIFEISPSSLGLIQDYAGRKIIPNKSKISWFEWVANHLLLIKTLMEVKNLIEWILDSTPAF